jgi:hypothetical protein
MYFDYRRVEKGIEITKTTIALSIFIAVFHYGDYDLEPVFSLLAGRSFIGYATFNLEQ